MGGPPRGDDGSVHRASYYVNLVPTAKKTNHKFVTIIYVSSEYRTAAGSGLVPGHKRKRNERLMTQKISTSTENTFPNKHINDIEQATARLVIRRSNPLVPF